PSLSHRYRQQGWQNDNQQQTPRERLHAFPPDLLLISGFPVCRMATRAAWSRSFAQSSLGSIYSPVHASTQPVTVVLCTTGWSIEAVVIGSQLIHPARRSAKPKLTP